MSAFIDIVARNFICQLPTKLVPFIVNLYMLPLTGVSATWRGHGRREAPGAVEDLASDGQDLDRKRDSLSVALVACLCKSRSIVPHPSMVLSAYPTVPKIKKI